MPPLPADSIHARACKLKCEKILTRPTPEHIVLEQMKKEALYQAISALSAADQALVQGLFFEGQSELDYAGELGISQPAVHKRKVRILKQLKKLLEN